MTLRITPLRHQSRGTCGAGWLQPPIALHQFLALLIYAAGTPDSESGPPAPPHFQDSMLAVVV